MLEVKRRQCHSEKPFNFLQGVIYTIAFIIIILSFIIIIFTRKRDVASAFANILNWEWLSAIAYCSKVLYIICAWGSWLRICRNYRTQLTYSLNWMYFWRSYEVIKRYCIDSVYVTCPFWFTCSNYEELSWLVNFLKIFIAKIL